MKNSCDEFLDRLNLAVDQQRVAIEKDIAPLDEARRELICKQMTDAHLASCDLLLAQVEAWTTLKSNLCTPYIAVPNLVEYLISRNEEELIQLRLNDLGEEEKTNVERIMGECFDGRIFADTKLVTKFNIDMTARKLKALGNRKWLNDEIINFYMKSLQERNDVIMEVIKDQAVYGGSFFFSTFFFQQLNEKELYAFKNVQRWTKNIDAFSRSKIIIPLNINNDHWTLVVIDFKSQAFTYYDSLASKSSAVAMKWLDIAKRWLIDEAHHKGRDEHIKNIKDWKMEPAPAGLPQQPNGYDCGLYVIMYASYICDDLPLLSITQLQSNFRTKVFAAILRGNLNY